MRFWVRTAGTKGTSTVIGPGVRKALQRYVLAVGGVAVCFALALALYPVLKSTATIFMMVAVVLAVRFCGTGPALLALVLMVLCSDYFLTTPRFEWGTKSNDTVWIAVFVILALTIILLGESLRRASAAIREGEISFQTALSSIADAVITTDTGGRVMFMNPVAESLTQVKKEDARMRPLHQTLKLLDEKTRTPERLPLSKTLDGHVVSPENGFILLAPDKTERPVEVSAAPLRDGQGRWQGAIVVMRDVTGRRQGERAMRESSVFARITLDALASNVFVLDEQGTIVAVNKSWRHFARSNGLQMPDNGVGASYLTVCDRAAFEGSSHAEEFAGAIRNILAEKQETFHCEYSLMVGGEERWYLARVTRFPGQGTRQAVITHEDITSLKSAQRALQTLNETLEQRVLQRTEEVVRAREALRQGERLAELGQMTAVLSHEGRNALQRIQATIDLLERRFRGDSEALRLIRETRRAQEDLRHIHEEVRGYAAPILLELSASSLTDVWRQAWASLEPLRLGRLAEMVETCNAADTTCTVDTFRIQQVFRNLLENALAACEDPVQIFIHCGADEFGGQEVLRVSIRDNGPGINSEQHERFFEPFYTTKSRGTGLGTAIAKRVIEAHGGRIWTEPPSGRGLEVVFTLPKDATPASGPNASSA